MRPLADEESLDLVLELGAETTVRADVQRLRQIIINLLSNAIKYTERGTVTVRSFRNGAGVVYEVQDTGAGISPADMPKVFTAFEQTDVAKRRLDSTGLGLPVSLGMATAMNGTLEAVSLGIGHGSTFRLTLEPGNGGDTELRMAALPLVAT
ncbi:MAG: sensor histidine kinase [Acidimicrobiia bacterium]